MLNDEQTRALWKSWQEGLSVRITLSEELPHLRMLLVLTTSPGTRRRRWCCGCRARGDALYTPLRGVGSTWPSRCSAS